ncbi:porin family protein [Psychrobacter phenylpyruvicus]|uniref:TPR repeat-containing protein NMB0313 n=1 Tax=Psychrobacter phenylpyruvicus TaxID=29432 RepID=A0A379LJF6_9GAMM|nr:porin family protein [Psychrobacter phenylpyruvicus]SUD90027.1 TPR repeat-containing protein NMB0313 precursor [Psychrobacter phenylpyruvicus]
MIYPHLLKTLTTSAVLFTAAYAPLIYAADDPQPLDDNDRYAAEKETADKLLELQREDINVSKAAPTANLSTSETQNALNERGQRSKSQRYNLEALKADPIAFTKFLNAALAAQDMVTVKELLPHYKALNVNDPLLIKFADALVYRSEGQHKKAIAIYKDMLADNPDFHPVRLNLAQALYADKQYSVAHDQLQKLRGADIPEPVMVNVERLIQRIDEQEQWRFNASVRYVYDDNLNDVPDVMPNGYRAPKEEGKGIQVSGSANKRFNLDKNFYAEVGGNATLKGYWDNSEYNDYLLTASAGVGYDDAKNDVSISPFVTKRFYSEDPYSLRKGVNISGSRWVKPKLKLTASSMYSNETFDDERNKARETDALFLGLNALYIKDAKEYFYGGIGRYNNDVPERSFLTYDRNSVNVGWGREWTQGISTIASLNYGVKKYDNPAGDFYGEGLNFFYNTYGGEPGSSREDKTTSLGLQVWKRDLTVLGLTPRLVFDYEKTSSNFKYYDDRDDKTATILLTKSF